MKKKITVLALGAMKLLRVGLLRPRGAGIGVDLQLKEFEPRLARANQVIK